MGNCLVTKLKGVVDNDNLPIFGKMLIVVGNNDPSIRFNKDTTVKILGGTIDGQTEISVNANSYMRITSSTIVSDGTYGEGQVGLLIDKYNISSFERIIKFDAEDLIYAPLTRIQLLSTSEVVNPEKLTTHFTETTFTEFDIRYNNFAIDLTECGSNGAMVMIRTRDCRNVYGSLNKAGMSPLTTDFSVPNTKNVSLNIETFVSYHRAAGRTTGSMSIGWLGSCNCTFNSASVANQENNSLSWTDTTITLNGTTINA